MPDLGPDDARELAALARGLDYADGFALFFARVDARRALVDALRQRLPDDLGVIEVDVPADTPDLEALLARRLADTPADGRRAVFVYGLEDVLSETRKDERDAFLRVLNFKRENLQRAVPHPVVLWVPEFALRILAVEAPDLWAWRSSVLDFAPSHEDTERTWGQLADHGSEDEYVRMTPAERRERAQTLESLYHDYSDRDDAEAPDVLRIRVDLADRLGRLYRSLADFERAERFARQSLKMAEHIGDEPAIARALGNLGNVILERGDFDEAEAVLRRALAASDQFYGPDHPEVAIAANNLGGVLNTRGDFEGASAAFLRALAIEERLYGRDHPLVANRLNNIGGLLLDLGDLDGAELALRRALAIDERAYGLENPALASRVNNLGGVLAARGDLDGAENAFRHALNVDEAVYGSIHPRVAIRLNNLANVLRTRGDFYGAVATYQRALDIFERTFGAGHPSTQSVRQDLTSLLAEREAASDRPA